MNQLSLCRDLFARANNIRSLFAPLSYEDVVDALLHSRFGFSTAPNNEYLSMLYWKGSDLTLKHNVCPEELNRNSNTADIRSILEAEGKFLEALPEIRQTAFAQGKARHEKNIAYSERNNSLLLSAVVNINNAQ